MRRSIAILMLLCCTACAGRVATIPDPQKVDPVVKTIVASDMPAPDKQKALETYLAHVERMYERNLERAEDAAKNVKESFYRGIELVASIAALVWAVSK